MLRKSDAAKLRVTFDAYLTFDKDFRTVYGFPPRTDKPKGKERRR